MTLILAINCNDSVVMASDGVTTTTDIQDWVQQTALKKMYVFDDLIIGSSGYVVITDRLKEEINQLYISNNKFSNLSLNEAFKKIEYRVKQTVQDEIKRHKEFVAMFQGASQPESKEHIGVIISFPHKDKAVMAIIDYATGSSVNLSDISFAAIGWYSNNVISYMSFIHKYLFNNKIMEKDDGIFCAVLAIKYAMDLSAMKIDKPVKINVLSKSDGKFIVHELSEQEIDIYINKAGLFENYLRGFKI